MKRYKYLKPYIRRVHKKDSFGEEILWNTYFNCYKKANCYVLVAHGSPHRVIDFALTKRDLIEKILWNNKSYTRSNWPKQLQKLFFTWRGI